MTRGRGAVANLASWVLRERAGAEHTAAHYFSVALYTLNKQSVCSVQLQGVVQGAALRGCCSPGTVSLRDGSVTLTGVDVPHVGRGAQGAALT